MNHYEPQLSDFEVAVPPGVPRYLITGYPGTGKTTLGSLVLFNHDVCRISSHDLYQVRKMGTALLKHRKTTHVLGLILGSLQTKGILFDDVDVFHSSDKKSYDLICTTYEDITDTRVMVAICDTRFVKNRRLQKWIPRVSVLQTHMSEVCIRQCVRKILRANGVRATELRLTSLSTIANFHRIYEAVEGFLMTGCFAADVRDHQDPTTDAIHQLLRPTTGPTTVSEMLRIGGQEAGVIGLTILAAIPTYMEPNYTFAPLLTRIYDDQVLGDISETCMTCQHRWDLQELVAILKLYLPVRSLQLCMNSGVSIEPLPYHTYLSRGMSAAHNRNVLRRLDYSPEELIGEIASYRHCMSTDPAISSDVSGYLISMGMKELRLLCQGVHAIYGYKITSKGLLRILSSPRRTSASAS